MARWTRAHLRHLGRMLRFGQRPAIAVYESIGADFFLAPAPGWLNLGWWEGPGEETEANDAPIRLVERIAEHLPRNGVIVDVANGLGAQDPVIARVAEPRRLIAVNITEMQLRAGRPSLRNAGAQAINADATRMPIASGIADGIISVEAAFHFPSRAAFFAECARILKPGGVLTMSDISAERRPRTLAEAFAGLSQLRFWGIRRSMLMSAGTIALAAERAGLVDVHIELVNARVLDPALRLTASRLAGEPEAPRMQVWGARIALRQVRLLRKRGFLQYVLLRARAPQTPLTRGVTRP